MSEVNQSKFRHHLEKVRKLLNNRLSIIYIQTTDNIVEIEKLQFQILPESGIYDLDNEPRKNDFLQEDLITWAPGLGFRKLFNNGVLDENLKKKELVDCIMEMVSPDARKKLLVIEGLHYLFNKSNPLMSESNVDIASALLEFYRINHNKDKENRSIIIIISQKINIPAELTGCIATIEAPMPDETDIADELGLNTAQTDLEKLLKKLQNISYRSSVEPSQFQYVPKDKNYIYRYPFFVDVSTKTFEVRFEKNKKELISNLIGMSISQIRALLAVEDNTISTVNLDNFREGKEQLVKDSGLLRIETIGKGYEENLGDIEGLKRYITQKNRIFENKIYYNLPLPKGIMLVGPPGCGKSETSKAIASLLNMPLLSLDMGRLLGNLVGDSEHNFERALLIAEAAQPCVLWIDEIEKAFAGADSKNNDDTMTRILGHLLTWMQEREKKNSSVYIVATANDLSTLRPEFLRKGRWDDIFYLTYPNEKGVINILCHCLNQFGLTLDNVDHIKKEIHRLFYGDQDHHVKLSGADIKAAVQQTYDLVLSDQFQGKALNIDGDLVQIPSNILVQLLCKLAKKNNDAEVKKAIDQEILEIKYQLAVQSPNSSNKMSIDKEQRIRELVKKKVSLEAKCSDLQNEKNKEADFIDLDISLLRSGEPMTLKKIQDTKDKIVQKYKLIHDGIASNIANEVELSLLELKISLLSQDSNPQDYELTKEKENKLRSLLWEKYKHESREEIEDYYKSLGFQSASSWIKSN